MRWRGVTAILDEEICVRVSKALPQEASEQRATRKIHSNCRRARVSGAALVHTMDESPPAPQAEYETVTVEKMMMFIDKFGVSIEACEAWSIADHVVASSCFDMNITSREQALELLEPTRLGPAASGVRDIGWHAPSAVSVSGTHAGMTDFAMMRTRVRARHARLYDDETSGPTKIATVAI